jgi:hypothetical protein
MELQKQNKPWPCLAPLSSGHHLIFSLLLPLLLWVPREPALSKKEAHWEKKWTESVCAPNKKARGFSS